MKHPVLTLCLALVCLLTGHSLHANEGRGAWIATVSNIDWPSAKAIGNPELQKQEMIRLLDTARAHHLNFIVFQVRPTADALYQSEIEPSSHWLTGKQGAPIGYDPLEFVCTEAHKRGLAVHVWLNPYRVTNGNSIQSLAPEHLYHQHPEYFVKYGKNYYFNPGLDETRAHLCRVVADIVSRYDVQAIHFDDYFYPYRVQGEEFPDATTFAAYPRGFDNIDDWRRNNVNMVIEELAQTIRSIKPWVEFGISPFGVWRNASTDPERGSQSQAGVQNYDDLYADILLWMEKGWIDYVAPQLYWEIGKKVADYEVLAHWWAQETLKAHPCKLYIGLAPYRLADKPKGSKGTAARWEQPNEIMRQIRLNRTIEGIDGYILFHLNNLYDNVQGLSDSLKVQF